MSKRRRTHPTHRRAQLRGVLLKCLGAAAIVAVVASLGVYGYSLLAPRWSDITQYLDPGNRFDLSYLPPNADCLIRLRPAAQRQSALVQNFVDVASYRESFQPCWELLGLRAESIESATFGAVNFGRQFAEVQGGRARATGFLTVLRTTAPVETLTFAPPLKLVGSAEHRGKSYSRISIDGSPQTSPLAVYTPDGTTILMGSVEYVEAAIDAVADGTPPPRRRELDFVNPEHQLLYVVLGPASTTDWETGDHPLPKYPEQFLELVRVLDQLPDAYWLGLRFENEKVRVEAACRFADATAATVFVRRFHDVTGAAHTYLAGALTEQTGGGPSSSVGSQRELNSTAFESLDKLTLTRADLTARIDTEVDLGLLMRRRLLRAHRLATAPFSLAQERVPRLMLGLQTITAEQ
jgi:hypothetical protein